MIQLAVNTDVVKDHGSPENILRAISRAGFTHLHWCHQWCTDFMYGPAELRQIKAWLRETHLQLLDIHGSDGREKSWYAPEEYQRKAGVELVRNRLNMMQELEATGALMMHVAIHSIQQTAYDAAFHRKQIDALKRSLDELMPELQKNNARIAIENLWADTWEVIDELMEAYPPQCLGICYDSGHANAIQLPQMNALETRKNRLMALHLHDNNQLDDQHQPPFMGNVDWHKLTRIIAASSYKGPLSFELSIRNTPFAPKVKGQDPSPQDIQDFLNDAYIRCLQVQKLLEDAKRENGKD